MKAVSDEEKKALRTRHRTNSSIPGRSMGVRSGGDTGLGGLEAAGQGAEELFFHLGRRRGGRFGDLGDHELLGLLHHLLLAEGERLLGGGTRQGLSGGGPCG